MIRRVLGALAAIAVVLLAVLWVLGGGWPGEHRGAGEVTSARRALASVANWQAEQARAARAVGETPAKQILFGDLHVHSTYSTDAFLMSLPVTGGDGAHPVADACDFARYCSALDFWSINDHALALTPQSWSETVDSIRECNEVAGDPENPDLVSFLGWEWTQMGTRPGNHYGHKNVVLRDLEDGAIPTRPISAATPPDAAGRTQPPPRLGLGLLALMSPDRDTFDLVHYFNEMISVPICPQGVAERDLPSDCREEAATPEDLFRRLDDWGLASIVIPHGTTWGFYTPQGSSWDKQLRGKQHDPNRQRLIEVYSGHGNSEQYRSWHEVLFAKDGSRSCPPPRDDYLPSCWRAGEIIRTRCESAGESSARCEQRAVEARQNYVDADVQGHLTVPGARPDDWLDSGQCRDCFQPAFNFRPRNSVQYIMALRSFENPQAPRRFEFGFIASSDNHSARPGTGYKEYARSEMTEARFKRFIELPASRPPERDPIARSEPFAPDDFRGKFFAMREAERQASFFVTGGLVAVHSAGRSRQAVWNALESKEVYGTSGPRILLWFDLLNADGQEGAIESMGSSSQMAATPRFRVRAVGSRKQKPGCPAAAGALGAERLDRLCRGECYNPSDERRRITRIEVIRIRPQSHEGESVDSLIEDPWKSFACNDSGSGCSLEFDDPSFESGQRDALYYVRAIEEPTPAIDADNLRCQRDERGRCLEVHSCLDVPNSDDCLAKTEQRAWSSPIFVAWKAGEGR